MNQGCLEVNHLNCLRLVQSHWIWWNDGWIVECLFRDDWYYEVYDMAERKVVAGDHAFLPL